MKTESFCQRPISEPPNRILKLYIRSSVWELLSVCMSGHLSWRGEADAGGLDRGGGRGGKARIVIPGNLILCGRACPLRHGHPLLVLLLQFVQPAQQPNSNHHMQSNQSNNMPAPKEYGLPQYETCKYVIPYQPRLTACHIAYMQSIVNKGEHQVSTVDSALTAAVQGLGVRTPSGQQGCLT